MEYITEDNRILLRDATDKTVALIEFPSIEENTVEITHTEVAQELGGKGIAGELTKLAAQHIRTQHKKVVLTCSYAIRWFHKHPEFSDILKDKENEEQKFSELGGPACSINAKRN